jgi:hypothetical protein
LRPDVTAGGVNSFNSGVVFFNFNKFGEQMSIKSTRKRITTSIESMHCDGPNHQGETFMQCDTITVEHGYGSPFDMETHHFCSVECLQDWAKNPTSHERS